MPVELPEPIAQALSPLLSQLDKRGVAPTSYESSSGFGSFAVSFTSGSRSFMIASDRGQFIVSGPSREELESAGLWQSFAGVRELSTPLLAWLALENAA